MTITDPESILFFPVISFTCDCKLKLFSNYFGNHFGRHGKLRSNWNFGVWLARDSQDDMHILGTRQGIVKARCVKRTIPSERYDQQLLLQMKGRPYDIKGDKVFESPPLAQLSPGTSSSSSSAAPMAS